MSAGDLILTDSLVKMDMALVPMQTTRMGSSGNSIKGVTGPTRWRLQVETDYLSMAEARLWDAWLANRIHKGETFTAWRLFRLNPGGVAGTADGSLTLTVDISGNQITVGGVGTGQAKKGDMISYRTDVNGYYLGMATGDVSPSSGTLTNIPMIPQPLAKHATTPAVRRFQALGEFELSTVLDPLEDYTDRRLGFEAIQVLR